MTTALDTAHKRVRRGTHGTTDLARIVADHIGWTVHPGGYIKRPDGTTVAQGWADVQRTMKRQGWIARNTRGEWVIDWAQIRQSGPARR